MRAIRQHPKRVAQYNEGATPRGVCVHIAPSRHIEAQKGWHQTPQLHSRIPSIKLSALFKALDLHMQDSRIMRA